MFLAIFLVFGLLSGISARRYPYYYNQCPPYSYQEYDPYCADPCEPTCDNPYQNYCQYGGCVYRRCTCYNGYYRDTQTNKCVRLYQCFSTTCQTTTCGSGQFCYMSYNQCGSVSPPCPRCVPFWYYFFPWMLNDSPMKGIEGSGDDGQDDTTESGITEEPQ